MKQIFKPGFLVIAIAILATSYQTQAVEKSKKYHESWPVSGVTTLEIVNKFGEVKVENNGGTEVTIDVVVTVETNSEKSTNDLLDKIDVRFSKTGSTAKAETTIESNFNGSKRMSIDYVVNVPSDKNLVISNKYGNTLVNELKANGDFNIQYGNFTAVELKTPSDGKMNISLAYSSASSVEEAGDLNLNIKYSGINISEAGNVKLMSRYSRVEIEEADVLQIDSKYDKLNFDEIESITANMQYTNIRIGQVAKKLNLETGYGSVKVGEISNSFESVNVNSSYGQISLGLEEASYTLDANCNYCGISYPEERFKGNKSKESNTVTIEGKVGTGGGNVTIRSRYGEIKLTE